MADIVKDATFYRIKQIELAEAEYYKSLITTLDRIEREVVSLASRLPLTDGKLIELQSAIAIRPQIKAILEREYLKWSDTVVREGFNKQAKRIEKAFKRIGNIPIEFQELTKGDLALVKNLKQQYFTQFKDVSNTFTRRLSEKVYQNTLVGSEFTVLEKELRQTINGIYASSDDPEIQRLVTYIKRNQNSDNATIQAKVDKSVQTLQSKFARDRAGENMKRYAGQILNDSLRDFDATLNFNKAKDAGLTYVKYYGDVIPTTRTLCRNMINGVYDKSGKGIYTIAEVTRIWNSTSWSGKKSGTPMVVRGGYNCRHQFSYVNPDWYEEDGEESDILKEVAPIIKKESKVNVSSYLNPITLANIKAVPIKESKARLQKQIDINKNDTRYPRNEDGSIKPRFRGAKKYANQVTLGGGVSEKSATAISVVFDELNDLADKYNIPRLRGIRVSKSKRYNAAMGDGVLYINSNFANEFVNQLRPLGTVKAWKYGDDVTKRPFSTKEYYDNHLDRFRNTLYHEFGHHVHQMKYVNNDINYGVYRKFTPKIEEAVAKLVRDERRKVPFAQRLIGNSEYGDYNPHEFFAEQFAAYSMGKADKVHPAFLKLIKDIENEVDR